MKKINTASVTSTARQPFLGRSVTHIKEGILEATSSIVKALIPTYVANDVVILHGLVLTGNYSGAGLTYSITAGAVYYNGEIYEVSAANGTISGSNVVVLTIATAYQSGDPVTMSDSAVINVHEIVTMNISQGATGSGTKDYSAMKSVVSHRSLLTATAASQTSATAAPTWENLTGITVTTPNDGRTRLYLIGYTCSSTQSQGGVSAQLEIQILQGAIQVDVKTAGKLNSTAPGVDSFNIDTCIIKPVLVPPNTIIKGQMRYTNLACTVDQQQLWAIELL